MTRNAFELPPDHWSRRPVFLTILTLSLISGCSGGSTLYPIGGSATFDGRPIPSGTISFVPDNEAGNSGPGTFAEINAGKYITQKGRGVCGGAYRVRVSGFDGIPVPSPEGDLNEQGSPMFPTLEMRVVLPKGGTFDIEVPGRTGSARKR